jgi:hypothetical protein
MKASRVLLGLLVFLFMAGLFVDLETTPTGLGTVEQGFVWNQNAYWTELENSFVTEKSKPCDSRRVERNTMHQTLEELLVSIESEVLSATDHRFDRIQTAFFELAPMIAACPKNIGPFLALYRRLRIAIKDQSVAWVAGSTTTRNRLYSTLFGSRVALEEVLLQHTQTSTFSVLAGRDFRSASPSALVHGVRIHSGDLLASRGGAPSSALVARGSDYPGNFSHISLVHVDEKSKKVSIIESHIEMGVIVADVKRYLKDKKLRIMVLRLREGHPALKADPILAHKAATYMLNEATRRHIPYDFEMDYKGHDKQFCSEVASGAYETQNVKLWKGLTIMTGKGVTMWLSQLGVRHFQTHGPSELEYDPQVAVVAEFRDLGTLFKDHVDNAIIDAMLEQADQGRILTYDWKYLPVARLAKAYSLILNWLGKVGPVPEGMSAATGLRVQAMNARHQKASAMIYEQARLFQEDKGYRPPYWKILDMARAALTQ